MTTGLFKTILSRSQNNDVYLRATLHSVAQTTVRPGWHLHHASRGNFAICATGRRRPYGVGFRAWTRTYAALLCRPRNLVARSRPQRRQRQRPSTSSTRRLSDVRTWPLPQAPGILVRSRMRSPEKHTTSVLVASKRGPATNLRRAIPDYDGLRPGMGSCELWPPSRHRRMEPTS
jgi:hypothetical protein